MGHTLISDTKYTDNLYRFKFIGFLTVVLIASALGFGGAIAHDKGGIIQEYIWPNVKYIEYRFLFGNTSLAQVSGPPAQSIPVLVYHGILDTVDEKRVEEGFNMKTSLFAAQMLALKRAGYQTVGIEDLYTFLRGEKELPDRSFVLTFDDGRKDSYYGADPVLRALDYKAVMFVIGQYSIRGDRSAGTDYYLTPAELREVTKTGRWELEAHTDVGHSNYPIDALGNVGHFYSNKLWLTHYGRLETEDEFRRRIDKDFRTVKEDIEKIVPRAVTVFAFPFGDFGQDSINYPSSTPVVLATAHKYYPMTFHQFGPGERFSENYPNERGKEGVKPEFDVKRIDVKSEWSPEDLLKKLSYSRPKTLPFTDNFSSDRGWVSSWSAFDLSPNGLTLVPNDEQGAGVVLDGTRAWKNYEVSALLESPHQSNVYIWVRFQDDNNNLGCNISQNNAQIVQTVNGEKRVIKGVGLEWDMPTAEFEASARVYDRIVECFVNGQSLVYTPFADPSLDRGGIGFKTWNPVPDKAGLTIKKVNVTPL